MSAIQRMGHVVLFMSVCMHVRVSLSVCLSVSLCPSMVKVRFWDIILNHMRYNNEIDYLIKMMCYA